MSAALISVVVATHGRPEALPTLLSSLQAQALAPGKFHVRIIVDGLDGSEARYRAVLEHYRTTSSFALTYEFQSNAGQSVARHRAIVAADTPWICVVDDDMELQPGFLEAHLALLEGDGPKAVVVGRVIPEHDWVRAPLYEAVRTSHMLEWHERLARTGERPWGQTFVTQNVAFARQFYLDIGGFDEHLRLGEDSEIGLRFELAGGLFRFGNAAAAIHRSRVGSYAAWLNRCIAYGRANVYIANKLQTSSAHPLRNLVTGSRLNALAVYTLCWSDVVARCGIAILRATGNLLRILGAHRLAIATHKAILAIGYHIGVKQALGSWRHLLASRSVFTAQIGAPQEPT